MLNKEVKAFAEKVAEAGSASVRLTSGCYVQDINDVSLVILWNWIFHSGNCPLKASPSALVLAFNQLLSALCISLIRPS